MEVHTYDRRQFFKAVGAAAAFFALPRGLAEGMRPKALARAYPEAFEGLMVPAGKPFAVKPAGQTPKGTSVLIRVEKEQPLHYHKTHTEVAFCLKGEGYAEVGDETMPLKPGLGVLVPPMTAHGFYGKMDLLSRFSPRLMGDIVFVKQGKGPKEGAPRAFAFAASPVPSGKRFSARPLANHPLATVVALNVDDEQPLHYHQSKDEAIYVVKGYGGVEVEGQLFLVKPGNLLLVPATARHKLAGRFEALSVFTPALAGDVVFV